MKGTNRNAVLRLLAEAQNLVKNGSPDRAAWRLADAGGLLRSDLTEAGQTQLAGLDEPTGMGFTLPRAERTEDVVSP